MRPSVPLAAVIGDPIAHSKSPKLHGFWLREYGITGHYVPIHVRPGELKAALRSLQTLGFCGANVTLPHKEQALILADHATTMATRIGAANTLTFGPDGKIGADNTDAYGFITNLKLGAPTWDPSAGAAIVLGAGGAARAIVAGLVDAGCREIIISNRSFDRAATLADELDGEISVVEWAEAVKTFEGASLVVNTTSLGMSGMEPFPWSLTFDPSSVVTDIVYTPLETPFLRAAAACGCATVNGLGMLLHQAVPGFERWFGKRPSVTTALRQEILKA